MVTKNNIEHSRYFFSSSTIFMLVFIDYMHLDILGTWKQDTISVHGIV